MDYIWRSVAAVILLGQVEFDPVSFKDVETKSTPGNILATSKHLIPKICSLLGIKSEENFLKTLLNTKSVVGKETFIKPNLMKKS